MTREGAVLRICRIPIYAILFLLTFVSVESLSMPNKSTNAAHKINQFDKTLIKLANKYALPGLAIGISFNDSLIYTKGIGFSDIDKRIQMTPDTPFRVASLTKVISSTILMQLVEKGTIDLHWKIKDYYPDYLGSCKRILGYFEQDLPEYSFLLNKYKPERDDITLKHHLSHTAEQTPGDHYKYNGFLFGMLTDVIEQVTKEKFAALVNQEIVKKLNLKHSLTSQLDTSNPEVLNAMAKPYILNSKGSFTLGKFPDPELNTGAGFVSSVTDLMLFDNAIDQNLLISRASKEAQFMPYKLNDGSLSPYGLGWFSQIYKGYTLVWHYGWQPNAYSGLYLKVLEKDLTLILLANSEGLSQPFALEKGDVLSSEFARTFLDLIVDG